MGGQNPSSFVPMGIPRWILGPVSRGLFTMFMCLSVAIKALRMPATSPPQVLRFLRASSRSASSTDLATSPEAPSSLVRLEQMRLSQLKDLAKKMNIKPGTLRKGELVQICHQQLLTMTVAQTAEKLKDRGLMAAADIEVADAKIEAITEAKTEADIETSNAPAAVESPAPRYKQKPRNLGPVSLEMQRHSKTIGVYDYSIERLDVDTPGDHGDEKDGHPGDGDFWFNGENVVNKHPVGAKRDMRLAATEPQTADMDLTFLGTASCVPSISRGVSCIAFHTHSDMWLFDCGESSQLQLQKSRVKASKIKKIFISHLHGDHSFGLPGVLCFIGQARQEEREASRDPDGVSTMEPIDIYGPEGIRDLIRSSIQLTYSRVVAPYRVHELKDVPYLHGRCVKWPPISVPVRTRYDMHYGEQEGGKDIVADDKGHYHILVEGDLTVQAAPMQHTVPCVGFVVTEAQRPSKLKVEVVQPIVERQKDAIKEMLKIRDANKVYAHLKQLKVGDSFTFPDGTVMKSEEFLEQPRDGRKIVIMGDTCTGEHIESLAHGADVLIHEATNSYLPELDARARTMSYAKLERDTFVHGHSTPQMAGQFAARINAKRLILTHFSPRYRGDPDEHSMRIMWKIEDQARLNCPLLSGKNDIIAGSSPPHPRLAPA